MSDNTRYTLSAIAIITTFLIGAALALEVTHPGTLEAIFHYFAS